MGWLLEQEAPDGETVVEVEPGDSPTIEGGAQGSDEDE